ncbi:MAG: hypothetical protein ACFFDW_17600, partial [Candidatus Thorarchaeota archaeon]
MSQSLEKARQAEEKGKTKIAAQLYLEAGKELATQGENKNSKEALMKAIVNAENAQISEIIIEAIFEYLKLAEKNEKKNIVSRAIKPLDELIEIAETKNQFDNLVDFYGKKITLLEIMGENTVDIKIKLGQTYQKISQKYLCSKKTEERNISKNATEKS